jgi:hypothetical protein
MRDEFYAEGGFFEILDSVLPDDDFIGVAVTGDWWDKKLDMNDARAKLGVSIMIDIMNRCIQHGKQLVVLRGTYSHDLNQLNVFEEFSALYDKFRLVNTVQEIKFGPLRTLCIPEEYPQDSDEYYAEFFSKKYDLVLGHGFFDFNCFDSSESEKTIPQMPVFEADLFCKLAPLTIFGHDHMHRSYLDRIWYNGSFSRLCHGEEYPKGFLYVEWDKKKPDVHFIENELAPKYITVLLDALLKKKKLEFNFENAVRVIEDAKKRLQAHDLKVKITEDLTRSSRSTVELLKNYFANLSGFRVEAGRVTVSRNSENVIGDSEEPEEERDTTYDFLFENKNIVDKVKQFIDVKYEGKYDITPEQIAQLICPN